MAATLLETTLPFDGAGVFRYLSDHAVPGIESGDAQSYRRAIRHEGRVAALELRLLSPAVVSATLDGGALPDSLAPGIRRLLDLDADSATIDRHLGTDAALAPVIAAHPGVRLPGALDAHEQLFRTLVGQQVSLAAARTVLGRLVAELGEGDGLFPTAEHFALRGLDHLRGPATRIASIHGLALALSSGELVVDESLSTAELTTRLVAMPGIGPWTAGYVAMRVLGETDVLLATDLVALKGARELGLPASARELTARSASWAPYRSYATLHLWRAAGY